MNIFITGATGFLGFHVANICVEHGHRVLCLRRKESVSRFSKEVEEKLQWVDKNESCWRENVIQFQPDVLIHCAWEGVSSNSRDNECIQYHNLQFFMDLLVLYQYKQIIALGSQEEYGCLNSVVDENSPLNPKTEYAKKKVACCEQLRLLSREYGYEWQWIRVFNIYGEGQKEMWLIPAAIKSCKNGDNSFPTTKGEQKYAYLYVDDFAKAINSIIGQKNKSGIYNLSSAHLVTLKELLLTIKYLMKSEINIDFGVYPYRSNQSMLICGNSNKFIQVFGEFEKTSLEDGLIKTIMSIN